MLFKNALYKIKRKKLEFLIFTLFFTLSIFIYTLVNTSISSMKESFFKYIKDQNVEDFSFTVSNNENLDEIAKQNNFYYEIENKKWISQKDVFLEIYPYHKSKKINKPYLLKGHFPKVGEITVSDKFAKENKLKIGDIYKINNKKYKISGFSYHPSLIYMMIAGKIYSNHKNVTNIYMNDKDYQKISTYEDITYVAKYNEEKNYEFFISYLSGETNPFKKIEKQVSLDQTLFRMMSIYYLPLNFELYELFSNIIFTIFIIICIFSYFLMLHKKIKKERRELALLKVIGYSKITITLSYLLYPLISFILGTIIGFILSFLFQNIFINILLKSYQLPILVKKIQINFFDISFLIFILLVVIFIRTYFLLRKDIIYLLKEKRNKISLWLKSVKFIIQKFPFEKKIKLSLVFERINLSIFTFLLSLIVSFLLLFILVGNKAIDSMITSSFKNVIYDYEIMYNSFQNKNRKGDKVLKYDVNYKNENIFLYGVKNNNKYIKSYDLNKNEIVINKKFSKIYKLNKNDKITLIIKNKKYLFIVKDVDNSYQDYEIFISFEQLNSILNMKNCYNLRYAKKNKNDNYYDGDVLYVSSIDEAKQSMKNVFYFFKILMLLLFITSTICLIFLFWFLSNSIVDENQNNIVLLKLFGYNDKKIRKMFLSTYDKIVIFAYIISSLLIVLCFNIVSEILLKKDFIFDVNIDYKQIIISFLIFYSLYYISLLMARMNLSKYQISEYLKRSE